DLPVGIRQRVEIIKALYRQADILILDEPTAVLTPQEVDGLFAVMDLLRGQGKSIIFITHKLKEVLRIADRIAVLRRGAVVGEADPHAATEAHLANLMVGREVLLQVEKSEAHPGDVVLETRELQAANDLGEVCLEGVNLQVRAGEIVGVAGVSAERVIEPFIGTVPTRLERLAVGAAWFASWRHQALAVMEPVMLVRVAADCWEVHSHGGKLVSESIVSSVCEAGAIECSGREWPGTLDESGKRSIRRRLVQAGGWRAAQILSRQLAGYFDAEVVSIEQFASECDLDATAGLFEAEHNLLRLERAARVGLRLPTPWRVVLRGVVNAGKSSLVNALAGYARSLVSPLAGTTRDLVETRLVLDGWEIELVDTAGETKSREV
ncbi:hypothetical protein EBU58_15305, partial [bacterium]|nr:hypothetical protein [bacterium]